MTIHIEQGSSYCRNKEVHKSLVVNAHIHHLYQTINEFTWTTPQVNPLDKVIHRGSSLRSKSPWVTELTMCQQFFPSHNTARSEYLPVFESWHQCPCYVLVVRTLPWDYQSKTPCSNLGKALEAVPIVSKFLRGTQQRTRTWPVQ